MSATVLIIDDDRELCALLAEFMLLEGFAASACHDGAAAVTHCRDHVYDVIVLDIMLPGLQGLEVLRSLRRFTTTPVLMLTARGEDTDRIVGLEMGADDYLPKPCNPRELAARLRAILRRSRAVSGDTRGSELVVGQTRLDTAGRSATFAGADLQLTSAEFNVLAALMADAGTVVDKESLCRRALGRPLAAYDRSVDVHISKLRRKIAALGGDNLIVSVRGSGYQFTVNSGDRTP
ncbi:MAG: response regulator transcription factor [Gammaproteobacteria bacterium]|nr:response regulator transcription factor [Gammaproteobacteria bacterium]